MEYKLSITDNAYADLDTLFSSYESSATRTRLADKLEEVVEQLGRRPFMFSATLDEGLARRGFRRVVIENCVMLYKVDQGNNEVIIHRAFHGKQNYAQYL